MSNLSTDYQTQIFREIKTEKVYVRVMRQIEELIKDGMLKPGDRLPPEKTLAERLGVSRPSVREAIVGLEILGLVECKGGKGNFIREAISPITLDQNFGHLEGDESPFELLAARKIVEVEVAGHAAQVIQENDLLRIRQSLESMHNIVKQFSGPQKYEAFSGFDREFHLNIARATHNAVLFRIVTQLVENLKEHLWKRMKERAWNTPGTPQKTLIEHEKIFSAIQAKDSDGARKGMNKHLTRIQRDLFGDL